MDLSGANINLIFPCSHSFSLKQAILPDMLFRAENIITCSGALKRLVRRTDVVQSVRGRTDRHGAVCRSLAVAGL